MKTLNELYPGIGVETVIKSIQINSKEVEEGDLFVCTKGVTADRHDFIDDAIKNGASAIIVSKDGYYDREVPIIKVPDTNRELPYLCQKFYDYPDQKLKMIGVTGTDGKTSVTTIIQNLIGSDLCGYIGTNGRSCAKFTGDNPNTTPDAHNLYMYLDEFVRFGCSYASIETSSEAFFRGRLQAMEFDVSAYTNITSEHLNIHGSFENYLACALLCCHALGFGYGRVKENIDELKVSGRLELLNTNTPYYVMVDYAHTPNGIAKLLNFVHTLDINRSIVVIGQAGERDPYKRPKVGNVVVENATHAIFTYEDPRSEDPMKICEDIISELKATHNNYEIVIDRREAITKAVNMAEAKDMVLILGKGNETYEKLKTETIYFNDMEEAYNAVAIRKIKEENK